MRGVLPVLVGLSSCLCALPAFAMDMGLPTNTFVQSWMALPTGHLTSGLPDGSFKLMKMRAAPLPDESVGRLLGDAFASSRNEAGRRNMALSEMATSWDQREQSAFERLREAAADYAGTDDARNDRFVATLTRVVDGTGRSAANEGSASAALESAYAAELAHTAGDARFAAEADQARWRTYGDAFAAFADLQSPGTADAVTAELERQRARALAATSR